MSAAIARMSSACFKPLYSGGAASACFCLPTFRLESRFLFFTASLRRFGAVFRLCCSAAAYMPLLLVHLPRTVCTRSYSSVFSFCRRVVISLCTVDFDIPNRAAVCRAVGLLLDHVLRQTDRALLR